ncbi:MAG: hypothetical protein VX404_04515 [Planctomycetota bacterium]|nr:hypothetical protein [Planctomycetota bacterium]
MMIRSELILLSISALLFCSAAMITIPLDRSLESDGISLPISETTGVPADVLLLQQSLGVFRGWAIDALWLRALERRDQGAFHESMQLANWITKLQPYFPRVWNFQAWMLAFEMALDTSQPEQRWVWVREAVDLLRGPALRANPLSGEIHDQLSYLFWFKIGEFQDEAAIYYQARLCQRWRGILGDPPGQDATRYLETLRKVAEAGTDPSQLPAEMFEDVALQEIIEQAWLEPEPALAGGMEVLFAGRSASWRESIEALLRRRVLERDMNMSVDLMVRMGEEFGAVDWRTPAAHAVYWGIQGALRRTSEGLSAKLDHDTIDEVFIKSSVRIGLQQMVARGRALLDDSGKLITILPQPGLLPAYERALQVLSGGEGIPDELLPRVIQIISAAIVDSWLQGEEPLAHQLLHRHDQLIGKTDRAADVDLISTVEELALMTLDTDEELPLLTIQIRARALVALGGAGTAVEAVRGEQLADLLERSLSEPQRIETARISLVTALRSPRAGAPLSVKRNIWDTLGDEQKQSVDETTRSLLVIEARRAGGEPELLFPGITLPGKRGTSIKGD